MNNITPTTTESKTLSPQLLRKRKMLLVLPLLILPFVTMAFWALGGGKRAISAKEETISGLNLQLPNAHLKDDKGETKLSFYELADQDSIKVGAQRRADPFFQSSGNDSTLLHYRPSVSFRYDPTPPIGDTYKDPNEEKVYQKLQELQTSLATNAISKEKVNSNEEKGNPLSNHSSETDGLEAALQRIGNNKESGDTELGQLNQMMDKIIAIQHPERVKEPVKEAPAIYKQGATAIPVKSNTLSISLLGSNPNTDNASTSDTVTGFFSQDEPSVETVNENVIPAVIPETQIVVNGAVVKLSLLEAITIQGQVISKGTFVYGIATLNNERLTISIHSIHVGNALYPVFFTAYDLDGLPGIYVPGTQTGEVVKGVTDKAFQSLELPSLIPSVGAQAASAGIQAAKSLLNKKASKVKVTLKAGYQVLLQEQ